MLDGILRRPRPPPPPPPDTPPLSATTQPSTANQTAINEYVTLSSAFVDTQRSPHSTNHSPQSAHLYKDNNRISTDTVLSPATTRHNQPTCTNTTTTTSATTANTQPCNSIHDKSTDMTQPTYRFADCGGIYNHNNTAFLSRYGHCLPSPQSLR